MSTRWRLGSVFGFPVYIDLSFLLLLGVAFLWLGGLAGVAVVIASFASVLVHELGHSLVARHRGVPVHAIELSFLGGAAQMSDVPRSARDEIAIAAIGPIVSLSLAGLGLGLGLALDNFYVAAIGWINLVLGLFNLIPALPMDGGRVLRALLTRRMDYVRATDVAVTVSRVTAGAFVVLGLMGQLQLLVLAPFLWMMGTRERQLSRALAPRFTYDRHGYREYVAPRWSVPVARGGFIWMPPRRPPPPPWQRW